MRHFVCSCEAVRRVLHHTDYDRQARASALYEELRGLDKDALFARARGLLAVKPGDGKQQMIAAIIENELRQEPTEGGTR